MILADVRVVFTALLCCHLPGIWMVLFRVMSFVEDQQVDLLHRDV